MKTNLKSANGFVRFLLAHGEKLGMAAVLAVAGLLIWSSLGRPFVEEGKQPPALTTQANNAKTHVENMSWDSFPLEDKTTWNNFNARTGETAMKPVDPGKFPPTPYWNPPAIDPVKLRTDPVLIAAADLEVRAGSGLWMQADPEVIRQKMVEAAKEAARERRDAEEEARRQADEAENERRGQGRDGFRGEGRNGFSDMGALGGMTTKDGAVVIPPTGGAQMQGYEDIREKSWVTVLAKIPIKQQFQMYEDALATARGFNAMVDQPEYLGYVVERAEVTDAGTGKFIPLKSVHEGIIVENMKNWPIQAPDLVNPKYIHPLLTYPLPPMVMREWGKEITHSELPLPTPEELMGGPELEEPSPVPAEEEEQDPSNPFGKAVERRTVVNPYGMYGRGGEMAGRMPMGRGGEMGGHMMLGRGGPMAGRMPMGRGGEMGGRGMPMGRGTGMGSAGEIELPDYSWDFQTKFLLFRYFDDTVQPGHRYRYRVRLVLVDVNVNQQEAFLDPEVGKRLAGEKKASAKADKPGKARGYRMTDWSEPSPIAVVPQPGLIFMAEAKDVGGPEPEARVVIKSVDSREAAEVALQDWFVRGSVLNFRKQAQVIWSSLFKVDYEEPVDSPLFDFFTDLTLIDFDGGEQLTSKNRDLTAPSRLLTMDSSGRLLLQSELEDAKSVHEVDYVLKQIEEAARLERERENDRDRGDGRGRGRF